MQRHRPDKELVVLLKLKAVLFKFALKLPRREHAIGSRVALYLAFHKKEERGQDIDTQPYRIIDDDGVFRDPTEFCNEGAPRSAVTDEAKARC